MNFRSLSGAMAVFFEEPGMSLRGSRNTKTKFCGRSMTITYKQRFTSSTAQGGGGSFKNRKRIGEIDCCE